MIQKNPPIICQSRSERQILADGDGISQIPQILSLSLLEKKECQSDKSAKSKIDFF
jgi:hypothetical protein